MAQGTVHKVRHAIFGPVLTPSPVTLCHTSRLPKSPSHISTSSRFIVDLVQKSRTKAPLYKFFLNCSRGFLRGSFGWTVLSEVVFVRSTFCQNTSVTTES